jgi:enamine deaminase RidA (YjgF/YER057c/UK114 family)
MTERTYVHPASWTPAPGYTPAVAAGGGRLLFVSGQVALDTAGQLVGGDDFSAQAQQAFDNLKTVLSAAGASFDDVVKFTYYIVDLDQAKVKAVRALRDVILPRERRPASTLIGVQALVDEGMLIEIEAIAELPPGR